VQSTNTCRLQVRHDRQSVSEGDPPQYVLECTVAKSCLNSKRLSSKDKLVWLMNTEEKSVLTAIATFILKKHEIAWLSFLLWTRGGLHITVH
jgi:hypothetical protein